MAADVYLQEAAGRVRDAIAALRSDIQTIQSEAYRAESQLHGEIQHGEKEVGEVRVEVRVTPDPKQRVLLEARIHQIENEVSKKKAEVARIGSDAAQNVQAKNSLLSELETLEHRLQTNAANARS